jgi:hypothetical protein
MRRPASQVRSSSRSPVAQTQRSAKQITYAAPIGGWIKNQNLTTPGAKMPDGSKVSGAFVLENWFPTATGVRMRGGSALYATIGDGNLPVLSIFSYVNGNNKKLFASTATDPTTLSYVWAHQRRLFFIKKDSLSAWYLPADSIGGAAVELPLGGVFKPRRLAAVRLLLVDRDRRWPFEQCASSPPRARRDLPGHGSRRGDLVQGRRLPDRQAARRQGAYPRRRRRRGRDRYRLRAALAGGAARLFALSPSAVSYRSRPHGTMRCRRDRRRAGPARSGRPNRWCWWRRRRL